MSVVGGVSPVGGGSGVSKSDSPPRILPCLLLQNEERDAKGDPYNVQSTYLEQTHSRKLFSEEI